MEIEIVKELGKMTAEQWLPVLVIGGFALAGYALHVCLEVVKHSGRRK